MVKIEEYIEYENGKAIKKTRLVEEHETIQLSNCYDCITPCCINDVNINSKYGNKVSKFCSRYKSKSNKLNEYKQY